MVRPKTIKEYKHFGIYDGILPESAPLKEWAKRIQDLIDDHGEETNLEIETYEYPEFILTWERKETRAEVERRVAKAQAARETKRKRDLKRIKELAAEHNLTVLDPDTPST